MSEQLIGWLAECVIAAYLDDCEDRGLRPRTLQWYGWHLRRGCDWLVESPEWCALDLARAAGVEAYYRSTRELARSTRRHLVSAWAAFGVWLARYGLENPAVGLKRPRREKRLPHVVQAGEVARLLEALEGESLRERALVLLLLDGGLRVGEAAALRRGDVDVGMGLVMVRNGKGGKDRSVYVSAVVAEVLGELLASHDATAVFVSERGQNPMTANGLGQALRRLGKRAGVAFAPHDLRRTCGTGLVLNGVDLSTVADQLGHEDLETVRIYTRLADEARRQVIREKSPVQGWLAAGSWSN